MAKVMTIREAIKTVLKDNNEGLTCAQIYQLIVDKKLYKFGAKNPQGVVNIELRRHCEGIDFPSAYKVKDFYIHHTCDRENYYSLLKESSYDYNGNPSNHSNDDPETEEMLPEEKMVDAYKLYIDDFKAMLIDRIRNCHPSFFEKLVVDILLAMGYGFDKTAGQVIGKSHDGGIDGIISEDKLGLSLIYVQAKRNDKGNNIGRPLIQGFIGAMQKAEKGVFITTSQFTKEAIDFANAETRKHVRLIDGDTLVDLIVKYGIGLELVREFPIYRIDNDYYSEI